MRRHNLLLEALVAAIVVAATTLNSATAAHADAPPNLNNCAGAFSSSLVPPGFGGLVSDFAHERAVDNLGFANCGAPPRKNP